MGKVARALAKAKIKRTDKPSEMPTRELVKVIIAGTSGQLRECDAYILEAVNRLLKLTEDFERLNVAIRKIYKFSKGRGGK